MPCSKVNQSEPAASTGQRYSKLEDCLQACKEGACCEGTTCSVKPQCQCQGTGKTFRGVGTKCSPNPCLCPNAGTSLELGRCCFSGFTQAGVGEKTKSECDALGGTWVAAAPNSDPTKHCAYGCTSGSVSGIGNFTCLECNPLP
jgi:hypothetical protein